MKNTFYIEITTNIGKIRGPLSPSVCQERREKHGDVPFQGAGRKAKLHPKLLYCEVANNVSSPLQTPGLPGCTHAEDKGSERAKP